MLPDQVSNPGPLTYESGALPIALRVPAIALLDSNDKPTCTCRCQFRKRKLALFRTKFISCFNFTA